MAFIAAFTRQTTDRDAISRVLAGTAAARFCDTARELVPLLASSHLLGVICDLDDPRSDEVVTALCRAHHEPRRSTLVVLLSLNRHAVQRLLSMAHEGLDVRPVLRGHDDLATATSSLFVHGRELSADSSMLEVLADVVPDQLQEIVVGCVLLGAHKRDLNSLSKECKVSVRTIERRIRIKGLPPPRRLMGWSVTLHALWNIEVLGWSAKRAASIAGFNSRDALGNYVSRHTGQTIGRLRNRGYRSVLSDFALTLSNHAQRPRSGATR